MLLKLIKIASLSKTALILFTNISSSLIVALYIWRDKSICFVSFFVNTTRVVIHPPKRASFNYNSELKKTDTCLMDSFFIQTHNVSNHSTLLIN